MAVARVGAVVVLAVVGAANAARADHGGRAPFASPFGGTAPVHIAHSRPLDKDLAPSHSNDLLRVPCFSAPASICFIARPAAKG